MSEQDSVTQPADKPATYIKTLKDLGPQLPVGQLEGTSLLKELVSKPWKMKQERELGDMREKHRDANLAQYISMVLGTMYKHFGGADFDALSLSDKRAKIGRMYMGDVFYAYIWLRIQALDNVLRVNLTCPVCSFKWEFPADLYSTEVTCASHPDALLWTYNLKVPVDIQGVTVTKLEMGPPKWRTLENADFTSGLNTGAAKALLIRGSIVKAPELTRGGISEADLDELDKKDIEGLAKSIDNHAIGPDMSVETKCTRCRHEFKVALDWGYDSFFGASSRYEP